MTNGEERNSKPAREATEECREAHTAADGADAHYTCAQTCVDGRSEDGDAAEDDAACRHLRLRAAAGCGVSVG